MTAFPCPPVTLRVLRLSARYLQRDGEQVRPHGDGRWMVNGEVQSAGEVVAYAHELRIAEKQPPFKPAPGEQVLS